MSPANISHAFPSSNFVAESGPKRYLNCHCFQTDLPVFQLPRMRSSVLSSGEILLLKQKHNVVACFVQALARVQILVLGDQGHGDSYPT